MALLTLIIALLIERYYHKGDRIAQLNTRNKVSSNNWFISYQKQAVKMLSEYTWFQGWLKEALLIVLPALIVFFIFQSVESGLVSSLIMLALAVLILVHCLGPESPRKSLRGYFSDLENQDEQGAYQRAKVFSGKDAENWQQTSDNVTHAIFKETQVRYFAVVIWFVLLGPAGALLYKLIGWYKQDNQPDTLAKNLLAVMEWVPARISSLAYLLAGDMASGIKAIKRKFFDLDVDGLSLVEVTGVAAMGVLEVEKEEISHGDSHQESRLSLSSANRCALKLSERTGVILFAFVAIVSLLGWGFM